MTRNSLLRSLASDRRHSVFTSLPPLPQTSAGAGLYLYDKKKDRLREGRSLEIAQPFNCTYLTTSIWFVVRVSQGIAVAINAARALRFPLKS
jgi:hypothetical protein